MNATSVYELRHEIIDAFNVQAKRYGSTAAAQWRYLPLGSGVHGACGAPTALYASPGAMCQSIHTLVPFSVAGSRSRVMLRERLLFALWMTHERRMILVGLCLPSLRHMRGTKVRACRWWKILFWRGGDGFLGPVLPNKNETLGRCDNVSSRWLYRYRSIPMARHRKPLSEMKVSRRTSNNK